MPEEQLLLNIDFVTFRIAVCFVRFRHFGHIGMRVLILLRQDLRTGLFRRETRQTVGSLPEQAGPEACRDHRAGGKRCENADRDRS